MEKIKKVFNLTAILLIVSGVFLCNAYAELRNYLRVPMESYDHINRVLAGEKRKVEYFIVAVGGIAEKFFYEPELNSEFFWRRFIYSLIEELVCMIADKPDYDTSEIMPLVMDVIRTAVRQGYDNKDVFKKRLESYLPGWDLEVFLRKLAAWHKYIRFELDSYYSVNGNVITKYHITYDILGNMKIIRNSRMTYNNTLRFSTLKQAVLDGKPIFPDLFTGTNSLLIKKGWFEQAGNVLVSQRRQIELGIPRIIGEGGSANEAEFDNLCFDLSYQIPRRYTKIAKSDLHLSHLKERLSEDRRQAEQDPFWAPLVDLREERIEYVEQHPEIVQEIEDSFPIIFGVSLQKITELKGEEPKIGPIIYIKQDVPLEAITHAYVPLKNVQEMQEWLNKIGAYNVIVISLEEMDRVEWIREVVVPLPFLSVLDKQSRESILGRIIMEIMVKERTNSLLLSEQEMYRSEPVADVINRYDFGLRRRLKNQL